MSNVGGVGGGREDDDINIEGACGLEGLVVTGGHSEDVVAL